MFVAVAHYQQKCLLHLHPIRRHACLNCTLPADTFVSVAPYKQICLLQLDHTSRHVCLNCPYQQTCLLQLHTTSRHVCCIYTLSEDMFASVAPTHSKQHLQPTSRLVCASCILPVDMIVPVAPYQQTCLSQLHPTTSRHICLLFTLPAGSSFSLPANMLSHMHPTSRHICLSCTLPADTFVSVATYQQTCLSQLHPTR